MSEKSKQSDCARIYEAWDRYAKTRDTEGLLSLYATDAVLETPLIPAIMGTERGLLKGHEELRAFFDEGARRRPNELVRWYRTGKYFCDGETLIWEYPRETPDGDQVDILEVMELRAGKIQHHRIYWGWFGFGMLQASAAKKVQRG